MPYVFLVYLTLPIFNVLAENGGKRAGGLALLIIFLTAYRQAYWTETDRGHLIWSGIQLAVIVTLSAYFGPYNLLLAFYVSNFIGWVKNSRLFRLVMVLYVAVLAVSMFLFVSEYGEAGYVTVFPFIAVMALTPIAVRNNILRSDLKEQLDEANERIRELSRQEERTRIARDLHDTLGHTLSLITLKSQVVQRVNQSPERVQQEAKGIEEASRSALAQVRELVSNMRSITFGSGLEKMRELLAAADIELTIEQEDNMPELPPLKQHILAMCLREAATNVVRHSGADRCQVEVRENECGLSVRVTDNGRGKSNVLWGNGLNGMRERLALIEGELTVKGEEGMKLELYIPLPVTEEGERTG